MSNDNVTGLAAQVSYFFVLSLFPFLIFLAAVVGTLPFTNAWAGILNWVILYFPRESQGMIFQIVIGLTQDRRGFLSMGIIATAWAASSGLMNLMEALNVVYETRETRGYLKRLGLASLMVLVLALLLLATFGLLTAGDWIDQWLAASFGGAVSALTLWRVTRWVAAVALLSVGIAALDRTLPDLRRPWRKIWPGVVFIVVGWLLASACFNLYASYLSSFSGTYGVLGIFIMLMIWIYIVSFVTLVGAELNSELGKMMDRTPGVAFTGVASETLARR